MLLTTASPELHALLRETLPKRVRQQLSVCQRDQLAVQSKLHNFHKPLVSALLRAGGSAAVTYGHTGVHCAVHAAVAASCRRCTGEI